MVNHKVWQKAYAQANPTKVLNAIVKFQRVADLQTKKKLLENLLRQKPTETLIGAMGVCTNYQVASSLSASIILEAEFHHCNRVFPREKASWHRLSVGD